MTTSRSGSEARAAYGQPFSGQYDGPYSMGVFYDVWGNMTSKEGWGGENPAYTASYTNNRRNGFSYDAAGNLTSDLNQTFTYDATGQQATASYMAVQQSYDGGGLRVKKIENGATRYYLRSSVLGGQVVAEMDASGTWMRGYVYQGGTLLAVQAGGVNWVHEDPVTKSKRVTDSLGNVVSTVELDPLGGDTNRSSNAAFQPKKFTSYERDANGSDEAMFRRYNRWHSRFDQPDSYDGSYNPTDPQSLNRYAYVGNDSVNFVDPSGLEPSWNCQYTDHGWDCGMTIRVSWADEIDASTGGPPEFGRPIIRGDGGGGGGADGRGGGGGGQKKPKPTTTPTPNANPQQSQFDDCAKKAWRTFRKGYLRDSVEAVGGGALVAGGIYITLRGIPGAGATGGVGVRAAVALGTKHGFDAMLHVAQVGYFGGLSLAALGSGLIIHSIKNSESNHSQLDAALDDCKKRFPNANHARSFLNF